MRLKCIIIWFPIAILLPYTSGSMFEGDACTMKSISGVCKLASNCPELETAVKSGKFSTRDIVNCGFTTQEEIICCPTGGQGATTDIRSEDRFIFEQDLPTTTTTSTIAPTSTNFWDYLLTTTPNTLDTMTTTTAKPDFWLHLLDSTSTTTTTTTTTSTTTPPPLMINGKQLDPDAGFIDLNELKSQSGQQGREENNANLPNIQQPTDFARQMPDSVDDRAFGWPQQPISIPNSRNNWNIQRPGQWQVGTSVNFQPNGGMSFHQNHRPQWTVVETNFFPNPVQNPQQVFNQRPFGPLTQQTTNSRKQPRNFFPGQMNQSPNLAFQQPFNNFWNEPQRNNNFEMRQPQQHWQHNQMTPINNMVENFGPNIYEQQHEALVQEPIANFCPNSASNNLPNRPIWPENNDFRVPNNINNQELNRNPITEINENLKNSGIDIVSAKENDQRKNGISNELFGESSEEKATTTRSPVSDIYAPFQFRPQPIEDEDTRNNPKWSSQHSSNDFRFPGEVEKRPIWSINQSKGGPNSDDVDSTTPRVTTRTTTTISPFPTRLKDRPAVIACREIDEGLDPGLTPHILGGTPVELGEFPHQAAIGFSDIGNDQGPYDYRCGGTLIAKRFVLTAAHCVNSRESRPAVVLLGLVNLKDENELRDAQQIPVRTPHIHKDYSSSRTYHDIAILELEREVQYSNLIYPTCLYTELDDPPKNSPLYVTGWGTINTATRETSQILLKAKLNIVSVNQCNESFVEMGLNRRIADGVVNTQLCAYDPGFKKDACQGDSGGPLNLVVDESLKKYRVVGVVSAGFSCGSATPGLYTRVAAYLDYIESIVWPHLA